MTEFSHATCDPRSLVILKCTIHTIGTGKPEIITLDETKTTGEFFVWFPHILVHLPSILSAVSSFKADPNLFELSGTTSCMPDWVPDHQPPSGFFQTGPRGPEYSLPKSMSNELSSYGRRQCEPTRGSTTRSNLNALSCSSSGWRRLNRNYVFPQIKYETADIGT